MRRECPHPSAPLRPTIKPGASPFYRVSCLPPFHPPTFSHFLCSRQTPRTKERGLRLHSIPCFRRFPVDANFCRCKRFIANASPSITNANVHHQRENHPSHHETNPIVSPRSDKMAAKHPRRAPKRAPKPPKKTKTPSEPRVLPTSPMPPNYAFLPKGNVYLTTNARKLTHPPAQVYTVLDSKNKPLGIRIPKAVLAQVQALERSTREKRAEAVSKADSSKEPVFLKALGDIFPLMPVGERGVVVRRAMEKGSGRVGRTGTCGVERRVRLAVGSHVRHTMTGYDGRLRGGEGREEVRSEIFPEVLGILDGWRGGGRKRTGEKAGVVGNGRVTRADRAKEAARTTAKTAVKNDGDIRDFLEDVVDLVDDHDSDFMDDEDESSDEDQATSETNKREVIEISDDDCGVQTAREGRKQSAVEEAILDFLAA